MSNMIGTLETGVDYNAFPPVATGDGAPRNANRPNKQRCETCGYRFRAKQVSRPSLETQGAGGAMDCDMDCTPEVSTSSTAQGNSVSVASSACASDNDDHMPLQRAHSSISSTSFATAAQMAGGAARAYESRYSGDSGGQYSPDMTPSYDPAGEMDMGDGDWCTCAEEAEQARSEERRRREQTAMSQRVWAPGQHSTAAVDSLSALEDCHFEQQGVLQMGQPRFCPVASSASTPGSGSVSVSTNPSPAAPAATAQPNQIATTATTVFGSVLNAPQPAAQASVFGGAVNVAVPQQPQHIAQMQAQQQHIAGLQGQQAAQWQQQLGAKRPRAANDIFEPGNTMGEAEQAWKQPRMG